MTLDIYAGEFNRKRARVKYKPHCVKEYRSKEDYVLCNCGQSFTAKEFDAHVTSLVGEKATKNSGLKNILDITQARFDYPAQGRVISGVFSSSLEDSV